MWKEFVKFVISLFWPEIKKFLAKYAKQLLAWLEKKFMDYLSKRNSANAQKAEQEAANAHEGATHAATTSEAEIFKAKAEIWSKVAEMFREENIALKTELELFRAQATINIDDNIESLKFEDAFDVSTEDIKAKENGTYLKLEHK